MNIQYPTGETRQFYDRNTLIRALAYQNSALAPHGITVRATYTVPAAKKAVITQIDFTWGRQTAAAPVGDVFLQATVTVNGVTAEIAGLYVRDNTLFNWKNQNVPAQIWLNAGDIINLSTFDGSTGGTGYYVLGLVYVEFDG